MNEWLAHVEKWKNCTRCRLCQQRGNIVLARGGIPADVVFIGEAPGVSEDAMGAPFKGPAGHLMDQIIERSLPTTVRYVLTNLVACFPREAKLAGTNAPERNEIAACSPRVVEFINIARPKLIVCVGKLAEHYIDHNDTVKCVDIIHPAAILKSGGEGGMPLAQRQMATQKAIVVLRRAVEDVVLSGTTPEFTKWGDAEHASQPTYRKQLNDSIDAAFNKFYDGLGAPYTGPEGDDIPF
jgi:uracil-DNA glycosylase family 4